MSAARAQRRRLQAAADEAEQMVEADKRYFARRPDRSHRVRLASAAEMRANALANGLDEIPTDPGLRWYCGVKQLAPGVRTRVFLQNDPGLDTDLSEWQAEYVYSLVASPGSQAQLLEKQVKVALAKRGGV